MNYPVTISLLLLISGIVIVSTIMLSIRGQLLLFWAYLPFVDMLKRMVFFDPNANATNMYVVLLTQDLLLLAILLKILLNLTSKPFKVKVHIVDLAVLLFALVSAISALTTPFVPISARIAAIGMRVWPMVTYFVAASYLNDQTSLRKLWKLSLILGIVVAVYGIRQFFFGVLPFEELWFQNANTSIDVDHLRVSATRGVFRAYGTLDSHSSYGLFLGMCLIFAWGWKRKLGLMNWLIISLLLTFGLILSFTRFTWLMPLLAVGFIFFFTYNRIRPFISLQNLRKASLLVLFVSGSFGIFYIAMNFLYGVNFFPAATNSYLKRAFGTGTLEARLRLSSFLGESTDLSIFGNGLAGSDYFARKFDFVSADVNYHNMFIDMIDAMGMVGLVLFLILLYLLIRSSIVTILNQTDPQNRFLLVVLFGLLLALLTVGHFNGAVFYYGRAVPVYFWSIAGILVHFEKPSIQSFHNDVILEQ